jgi:hypothetical protein
MISNRTMPHVTTAALAVMLLLAGCATGFDSPDEPPSRVEPLELATRELPPDQVLDIHVVRFEANVPSSPEQAEVEQIFTDVRNAEASYVPFNLRQTLQRSGQWGDVRVVPTPMEGAELQVTGRIVESHGELLQLQIRAEDATGRIWLDREYREDINAARYRVTTSVGDDPFQSLYNRIANDLVQVRAELAAAERREIAEVGQLRFAAQLAPQVYGPRLVKGVNGRLEAVDAPDPLIDAIDEARQRDARMVDILDQHYNDFHRQMEIPYGDWREASYREMQNLKELRRQANTRKALGRWRSSVACSVPSSPIPAWANWPRRRPSWAGSMRYPAASTRAARPASMSNPCASSVARWRLTWRRRSSTSRTRRFA